MNVERDALGRIDALGLPWFVTGSWALAAYAEPRMTRDIDVVLDATRADYESVLRPSFESDFLVNDPIDLGGRACFGARGDGAASASRSASTR